MIHRKAAAALATAMLLLAACAAPRPPAPEPPLPYPPAARERMQRIALAEWADWGCLSNGPGPASTPCPAQPAARGFGPAEGQPGNFPRVLAYWRAVPEGGDPIRRNRAIYRAGLADPAAAAGLWAEPAWSAAFISFVLRGAGVDAREFPPSAAHAFYIDALLADARAFPATAPFLPQDPGAYAPQPGDLVCADRSPRPLADWRDRLAEKGEFRPMHCDIVVAAPPGAVEAIGGNVGDAVTLSRFPADAAGRLLPRRAGAPRWTVVFLNRLGRLPPWDTAPGTAGAPLISSIRRSPPA
jgi:hypothetical protein